LTFASIEQDFSINFADYFAKERHELAPMQADGFDNGISCRHSGVARRPLIDPQYLHGIR